MKTAPAGAVFVSGPAGTGVMRPAWRARPRIEQCPLPAPAIHRTIRHRFGNLLRERLDIFLQQLVNGLTLGSVYAIVALGYTETIEAAVKAIPALLPDLDTFSSEFAIVTQALLDAGSQVLVLNIPDVV